MSGWRIFLILGILVLIISSGCMEWQPRAFLSRSKYKLTISTNEPIHNLTFYLPLPVKNDIPQVGEIPISQSEFERSNTSAEIVKSPPGIDEVDLSPGDAFWFVVIRMDSLFPTDQYSVEISDYHTGLVPPVEFIQTLTPIGNESIILPKLNFTYSSPCPPVQQIQSHLYFDKNAIPQDTLIFTDYMASPSTRMFMQFSQNGLNQWQEGYDDWRFNSYDDSFIWEHEGSSHGWYLVGGTFRAGSGSYPDPSHPDWQNLLKTSGADFCL